MIGSIFSHLLEQFGAASLTAPQSTFLGIDFLVGGVWVSQPAAGSAQVSEMVFRCLGERFLMADNTSMTLSPLSASIVMGIMGLDPAQPDRLIMTGFASTGSTIQLASDPVDTASPAGIWTFVGVSSSLLGRQEVRQEIVQQGADQFQTNLSLKDSMTGAWTAVENRIFVRQ
jgi:hypothetical protein